MQEDGFDTPPWTAENLDRKDLLSPNFIAEAADLSYHRSPLLSFEDILAQEESLLPDDGLDDVAAPIGRSSTTEALCLRE